jgi:hypothetical protein
MYVPAIHIGLFMFFVTHKNYNIITWEQELLTLPEHLSSPPVFSRVFVIRSLVLCLCFVDRCLSFFFWPLCCLSFDLRILYRHPNSEAGNDEIQNFQREGF